MSAAPLLALVRRITPDADTVPDAELLDRFARHRDQAAFELLVWRHAALVWGVCRRMLAPDSHAAEDACQAAFVALAKHAGRVRDRQAVAGWLHRVAVRASLDLLADRRPNACADVPDRGCDPVQIAADRELGRLLDAGLNRLPDKLRMPFVLCELEGKSNAEAAAALGCPVGTVESRLTRARQRLRGWLSARGVAPAAVLAVAVPESLQAALLQSAAPGAAIGPAVRALAERAVRFGFPAKLRAAVVVGGVILAAGVGAAVAGGQKPKPAEPPPPTAETPTKPDPPAKPAGPRVGSDGVPLPPGVVARLGQSRLRAGGWVRDLAYSPDGKYVAAVAYLDALRVWDAATGKLHVSFRRPAGEFDRVAFNSDGRFILIAGRDIYGRCELWQVDAANGNQTGRFTLSAAKPARPAVRFSRDGSRLAIAEPAKKLHVFDTATCEPVWSAEFGNETPGGVAFSGDGKTVAVSTKAGSVRLFDAAGKPAGSLTAKEANLGNVALSPDGSTVLANNTATGDLIAWNRATGAIAWRQQHRGGESLTFSPDGSTIGQSSQGFQAFLVNPADGQATRGFESMVDAMACAFRPDRKQVAFGTLSGAIGLFDPASGKSSGPSSDPPHEVRWMRFSPNGKTLYGWAADWYSWDVARGTQRQITHGGWSYGVPISADGRLSFRLVQNLGGITPVGADPDANSRFEIFDIATDQAVKTFSAKFLDQKMMTWKDFTPDGRAVIAGLSDGTVRAWSVDNLKELFSVPGHTNVSQYHAFSLDGRVLVTGVFGHQQEDAVVRVIDLKAGRELVKFHPGMMVSTVAISADGRRVAGSGANFGAVNHNLPAIVWDVASGKELARVSQHGEGGYLSLSPDGRLLAVASHWTSEIPVWEVASRAVRFHFRHDGQISGLAFAPNGRLLAAASKEAPVYLWDTTGDLAAAPPAWDAAAVWDDLGSADAAKAFTAIRRLRANATAALPLLRERTKLAPAPEADVLKKLFAELDSPDFAIREKATAALAAHGEAIVAALKAELAATKSGEARTRLQGLLDRLLEPTPARLRLIRAVEAVEGMPGAEAAALLETWSGGDFGPTPAAEAKAALGRRK
ncbi:MAG: sigma-70 family RNA polymerase sigma factor [Gemmataceae bacterium]